MAIVPWARPETDATPEVAWYELQSGRGWPLPGSPNSLLIDDEP